MFSAGGGESALDRLPESDPVPTSVYARSLLALLSRPGMTLQDMAIQVRDDVGRVAALIGHRHSPA